MPRAETGDRRLETQDENQEDSMAPERVRPFACQQQQQQRQQQQRNNQKVFKTN